MVPGETDGREKLKTDPREGMKLAKRGEPGPRALNVGGKKKETPYKS